MYNGFILPITSNISQVINKDENFLNDLSTTLINRFIFPHYYITNRTYKRTQTHTQESFNNKDMHQ